MAQLKQALSFQTLTLIAIGSTIGSGIFLTPSRIAQVVPEPLGMLITWIIGGLVAIAGALTYAELGSIFTKAGGIYNYLNEAYGKTAGFLWGWANLTIVTTGSIAALALAFSDYLCKLLDVSENVASFLAIGVIILVTTIAIIGVKFSGSFSSILTILKLIGIALIISIGFIYGSVATLEQPTPNLPITISNFGMALVPIFFAYGGWQHVSYLAGEAKNPAQDIPRAMVMGTGVVLLVYLLTNLAYLFMLPINSIAHTKTLALTAVTAVLGQRAAVLVALIIMTSILGTASIYAQSSPRIYFAMANDRLFFKALAQIHPRFLTPVNAILLQNTWAIILVFFWQSFNQLLAFVVFTEWIFFILAAYSIFIFRKRGLNPAYKCFLFPLTPILFLLFGAGVLLNTLWAEKIQALVGLGLLGSGYVVYKIFFHKK